MISKQVSSKSSGNGNLGRLIDYLTDTKGRKERVAAVNVTNCNNPDNLKWSLKEMQAVQGLNIRATSDKTYHLVISFAPGEDVSSEKLAKIEERFCEKIGFKEHQRISVLHRDTDNLHVHVAINKIHPVKLTLHEPYYGYLKREDLCKELEKEFGLIPGRTGKELVAPKNEKAAAMEAIAGVESLIGFIQRILQEPLKNVKTWQEFHAVAAKEGVFFKLRGNVLVVESDGQTAKASSCSRGFSKAALEKRFGSFEPGDSDCVSVKPGDPLYYLRPGYWPQPMQAGSTGGLYGQYKAEREAAKKRQGEQILKALTDHRTRIASAKNKYKIQKTIRGFTRRNVVNNVIGTVQRVSLQQTISESFKKYKQERAAVYKTSKLLAWNDWLIQRAENGDKAALAALQSRRAKTADLKPPVHEKTEMAKIKEIPGNGGDRSGGGTRAYVTRKGTVRGVIETVKAVTKTIDRVIDEWTR